MPHLGFVILSIVLMLLSIAAGLGGFAYMKNAARGNVGCTTVIASLLFIAVAALAFLGAWYCFILAYR